MKFIDRIDAVAKKLERFVAGNAVNDPLYVSNRSFGQKVRIGLLIGTPILALGGLIYLALSQSFDRPIVLERNAAKAADTKSKEPTGEVTAKILPNLEKDYTSEQSRDVEVIEAAVSQTGDRVLSGKVRNNSDQIIRTAELVFDVTDNEGSQLGGVSVKVENIPARGTAPFRVNLQQRDARTALVREVRSH